MDDLRHGARFGAVQSQAQTDTNAPAATNRQRQQPSGSGPGRRGSGHPARAQGSDCRIRLADLEAYVNNGARGSDASPPTFKSNILQSGPGHNGWMMVSTAFVLMMTLPGLALFYGGLVRRKNVLSVIAQCFGITGLVTILWYFCGYSLVFGTNEGAYWANLGYSPLGDLQFAMLRV